MTDHDPMLDGITRYRPTVMHGGYFSGMEARDLGTFVLFSDLPALIAAAREDERGKVNPPTPFPMGAKVRGVGGTRVLTVTGWGFYPAWGKWFVRVETGKVDEEGEREYALMHPWELELVTYEQGQRDEREAAARRVTALRDESEVQLWSDIIAAARGEKS